jgi:hypothetical protein
MSSVINLQSIYEKSTFPIDRDIKRAKSLIGDITFGIELETIKGYLPDWIRNRYGTVICRDGSLNTGNGYPPEYVTIPLQGTKGLQTIRNVAKEIQKRAETNVNCAYHIHLGNMDMSRIFLIALYRLCEMIQEDVFKMFPYYKRDEPKYAGKAKSYSKMIPDVIHKYNSKKNIFKDYVNSSYESLFQFITGGCTFDNEFNFKNCRNPFGSHKWDIATRYYWINFTNIVFKRQQTVEFRLHTPTLNHNKIINWLVMCVAIIRYTQINFNKILTEDNICFTDVLSIFEKVAVKPSYGKKISDNLISYYNKRVKYFENDYQNCNYISEMYLKKDLDFDVNALSI